MKKHRFWPLKVRRASTEEVRARDVGRAPAAPATPSDRGETRAQIGLQEGEHMARSPYVGVLHLCDIPTVCQPAVKMQNPKFFNSTVAGGGSSVTSLPF